MIKALLDLKGILVRAAGNSLSIGNLRYASLSTFRAVVTVTYFRRFLEDILHQQFLRKAKGKSFHRKETLYDGGTLDVLLSCFA